MANHRTERAKTDKALGTLQKDVAIGGDPLHLAPAIAKPTSAWRATAASTDGADGQGGTVFGPTTEALAEAMTRLAKRPARFSTPRWTASTWPMR